MGVNGAGAHPRKHTRALPVEQHARRRAAAASLGCHHLAAVAGVCNPGSVAGRGSPRPHLRRDWTVARMSHDYGQGVQALGLGAGKARLRFVGGMLHIEAIRVVDASLPCSLPWALQDL